MDTTWPNAKIPDYFYIFFSCLHSPQVDLAHPPHSRGVFFLDHTQRHTTLGKTPLDEWLVARRYLYLTTHNTQNREISIPPVGLEHTI